MYDKDGGDGNVFTNLLGGDISLTPDVNPILDVNSSVPANYNPEQERRKGVFARYPATTPKFTPTNDDRALETMARLIVPMSNQAALNNFVASFGKPGASEAQKLAKTLASIGNKNGTGQYGLGYIDFLLVSAVEQYQEKVQIVDVLSDNYVAYYFGAQPPVFQYSGVLLNSKQDDWRSAFTIIYNDIIRGTELARRRAVVTLSYDNMAVTGTVMNMSQNFSADGPFYQLAASFNFSLLVQRIDVERVTLSEPTQVATFPSYVKPGAFASRQFDVPPKTIRSTGMPSSQTVDRKKTNDEENPYGEANVGPPTNDVYGADRGAADEEQDDWVDQMNGQTPQL